MVPITQVLCPIDFSDFSKHAFGRAVAVAREHGASLTVLHVCPSPSAAPLGVPFGPEGPGPFILHDLDRDKAAEQMAHFLASSPGGVAIRREIVEAPSAYRGILDEAERIPADLIVLGTHGRSGFDRWLMGSVTEKVLRRAAVPVLTVPPHAADVPAGTAGAFRRVLCAIDFSACSRGALEYAASFAREAGGALTVLHAVELAPFVYETTMANPFDFERERPALEQAAREHLERFTAGLQPPITIERVVTTGKPYVEILERAAERKADLIVLGVHGHGAIDRLLFGSTAGQVVRRAACPVLTVRQPRKGH
jgi:nucleotide-binding universal stress UspA family protein